MEAVELSMHRGRINEKTWILRLILDRILSDNMHSVTISRVMSYLSYIDRERESDIGLSGVIGQTSYTALESGLLKHVLSSYNIGGEEDYEVIKDYGMAFIKVSKSNWKIGVSCFDSKLLELGTIDSVRGVYKVIYSALSFCEHKSKNSFIQLHEVLCEIENAKELVSLLRMDDYIPKFELSSKELINRWSDASDEKFAVYLESMPVPQSLVVRYRVDNFELSGWSELIKYNIKAAVDAWDNLRFTEDNMECYKMISQKIVDTILLKRNCGKFPFVLPKLVSILPNYESELITFYCESYRDKCATTSGRRLLGISDNWCVSPFDINKYPELMIMIVDYVFLNNSRRRMYRRHVISGGGEIRGVLLKTFPDNDVLFNYIIDDSNDIECRFASMVISIANSENTIGNYEVISELLDLGSGARCVIRMELIIECILSFGDESTEWCRSICNDIIKYTRDNQIDLNQLELLMHKWRETSQNPIASSPTPSNWLCY